MFWLCLSVTALHLTESQFRGFSQSRTNTNHDLLKQIVDHTPETEEETAENRLTRFGGGRRTSILDRARSRPNTYTGLAQRSRPRFTPSVPRFGTGANNLNVVTPKKEREDSCGELRGENELLKQLVESLQRQQQAAGARENILKVQMLLAKKNVISQTCANVTLDSVVKCRDWRKQQQSPVPDQ